MRTKLLSARNRAGAVEALIMLSEKYSSVSSLTESSFRAWPEIFCDDAVLENPKRIRMNINNLVVFIEWSDKI